MQNWPVRKQNLNELEIQGALGMTTMRRRRLNERPISILEVMRSLPSEIMGVWYWAKFLYYEWKYKKIVRR
jgi:hypothetical protein